MPASSVLQRRAQALTTFVGYAVKPPPMTPSTVIMSEGRTIGDLVSLLIESATAQGDHTTKIKMEDVSNAARSSLSQVLATMPVTDFIHAVLTMLESGESRVSLLLS